LHVEMPVTEALDALLNGGATVDAAIARLVKHLPPLYRTGTEELAA
jgi:hypothetical protein